jgi:WD40 repeat protein
MTVLSLSRWVLVLAVILGGSSATTAQRDRKEPTLADIQLIRSAVFSPDGNALLVHAVGPIELGLWDTKTGQLKVPLERKVGPPSWDCIAISPDGKKAAAIAMYFGGAPVAKMGRDLAIWDLATGKIVEEQTLPEWKKGRVPPFLEFSADRALLYSLWGNRILEIKVGGRNRLLAHNIDPWFSEAGASACAFDPDAKLLILVAKNAGKPGDRLVFIPLAENAKPNTVPLTRNILSLALSPDGKTLALSYDGRWDTGERQIELWDVATRRLRTALPTDTRKEFQGYNQLVFARDGKTLAGVPFFTDTSIMRSMMRERLDILDLQGKIRPIPGDVSFWAISPDGQTVAVTTGSAHLRLIDVTSGKWKTFVGREE